MKFLLLFSIIVSFKQNSANRMCDGKCIRKCCPNEQYVTGNMICKTVSDELNFAQLNVHDESLNVVGQFGDYFHIKDGVFLGDETYVNYKKIFYMPVYYIIEDGSLIIQSNNTDAIKLNNEDYCLDYAGNNITRKVSIWAKVTDDSDQNQDILLKSGLLLSAFFLTLVLIVYSLLPELRNQAGLILMSYVSSLLVAFLLLFTMQVGLKGFNDGACISITLLIYFFVIASSAWVNVMSYDIWWTFRSYVKARAVNRHGPRFKFLMYNLYACGVALALTIIVAVMNIIQPPGAIKPEIPMKGCFLSDTPKLVYMYLPMLLMILTNWLFFGLTLLNIRRKSRGTEILASGNSMANSHKYRFKIYFKLSVLMGLNWILEVISSFSPDFKGWYISDVYNAFIGLLIFIVFVCKKKVYQMLKARFQVGASKNPGPKSTSHSKSKSFTSTTDSQGVPLNNINPYQDASPE